MKYDEEDEEEIMQYDLNKGSYGMLTSSENDLPRWQLNMDSELESFKRSMLGVVKNPNVNPDDPVRFIKVMGAESVSETGAIAIYNKFMSYLTKLTSDTKLDEESIKREVFYADDTFTEWLARNCKRFRLSSKDYRIITEQFSSMYKMALYRSYQGWKGDLINKHPTTREVVYRDSDEAKKSSGITMPWSFGGGK